MATDMVMDMADMAITMEREKLSLDMDIEDMVAMVMDITTARGLLMLSLKLKPMLNLAMAMEAMDMAMDMAMVMDITMVRDLLNLDMDIMAMVVTGMDMVMDITMARDLLSPAMAMDMAMDMVMDMVMDITMERDLLSLATDMAMDMVMVMVMVMDMDIMVRLFKSLKSSFVNNRFQGYDKRGTNISID